ncbi:hypothetical protein C2S52_000788 [Perilla frutescens var. hirtella]|nr:hypothetical protein C2S52_000788 [Perilla frutescens var. hirtella]
MGMPTIPTVVEEQEQLQAYSDPRHVVPTYLRESMTKVVGKSQNGHKGQQEAGESLLESTRVPMIPRWATTSQRKALSRAWQKSPTIPAKAEEEVCDRAHNNPRVIKRRRKGDWAQGKLMLATVGAMHPSHRRKEEPRKAS